MSSEPAFRYAYRPPVNRELAVIRRVCLTFANNDEAENQSKTGTKGKNMSNNDQEFLVQKIRTQYTEKQHTELDALKALDARVKRPVHVFGYIYGGLSAIIMGAGMSLVMTDIGSSIGVAEPMTPGIVIGVVGLAMAVSTWPICKKLLAVRKKKYAPEILKLSEKITNG